MEWFARDFDHPLYFRIYQTKEGEAAEEGPALAALLDLPPAGLVLDLPCGWGRLQGALKARGYRVFGGDLSRLNLTRLSSENGCPSVRLDLRALPFRDRCADGVLCAFTSWGYFATETDNLQQLAEFARVLKPGGILLLDLAGRHFLERATAQAGNGWFRAREGYRERVRWSADGRRILTERILEGERFRHDIWIPTHSEVLDSLHQAGLDVAQVFGGLDGSPFRLGAERWIYRAIKP